MSEKYKLTIMKELTIEQKAKAYDEAIERAKKLQETCDSTAVVGWCEYIFPEFKESEDEQIRKELIDYHRSMAAQADDYVHEAWIAWLEKQQKPTWSEEDEEIALGIEQVMICASFLNIVPDKIERIRTWLKSLKERLS